MGRAGVGRTAGKPTSVRRTNSLVTATRRFCSAHTAEVLWLALQSSFETDSWIEGQANRAKGRRILAELPRLGRGEGFLWAPSDGVLARVAFPRIRSFDSSRTPERLHRAANARTPTAVDLPAIAAALAGMEE